MNKKAEGPIGLIIFVILFMVMWFMWLAEYIGVVGMKAITDHNLSGVEAFFFANLNVMIFIFVMLGIIGYGYFSFGE